MSVFRPEIGSRPALSVVVLFFVVGLVLYSRVILFGPFLFDDVVYVVGNPAVESPAKALTLNDPRQLGYISFALNYALGGENPVGYHLVNVIIHIFNGLLSVFLAVTLFRLLNKEKDLPPWAVYAACLTGFIFLVHPLQTQAVSYVTQRFTSLATFFYLLSVDLYLYGRKRIEAGKSGKASYSIIALSFVCTVAAMKTKEIAFTIPLILLAMEILFFSDSGFGGRRFMFIIPFLSALAVIPLSVFGPEMGIIAADGGIADITRTDKIHDLTDRSSLQYFFTELRAVSVYIRLLIMPAGLRVVYDFPISRSFFEPAVAASSVLQTSLAVTGVYLWKTARSIRQKPDSSLARSIVSVGILWFFLTLSVESSVFPIKDVIFEHRAYLPSFGFFIAAATLIMFGVDRLFGREALPAADTENIGDFPMSSGINIAGKKRWKPSVFVMLLIALPLSAGTFARNEVWVNELNLWNDAVKKSPGKAMGYNNRAAARARLEDYGGALEDYNRVIGSFPKSIEELFKWENSDYSPWNMSRTYNGRGNIHIAMGENNKAEEDFRRAKEVFSMPVDADNMLIDADKFAKSGDYRQAVKRYDLILEWNPRDVRALNDRANAYMFMKRFAEAVSDLTRVVSLDPSFVLAYHNRGIAYAWSGKAGKAEADFRKACGMGFDPACGSIGIMRTGGR